MKSANYLWVIATAGLVACAGAEGPEGPQGPKGDDGPQGPGGVNALVRVVPEPEGTNCPAGGVAIRSGLDSNGNNQLDEDEVTQTEYVCNTPALPRQRTVQVRDEAPGEACPRGGVAIVTGIDLDDDGELTGEEVDEVQYVCHSAGIEAVWFGDVRISSQVDVDALAGIEVIMGDLEIREGAPAVIELPLLRHIGEDLDIYGAELTRLSLPSLAFIGDDFEIYEATIETLELPALKQVRYLYFEDAQLGGLSLPQVKEVYYISIEDAEIPVVELPALSTADYVDIRRVSGLTELDLPSLVMAEEYFGISFCDDLEFLSLPLLEMSYEFDVRFNDSLSSLSAPALTQANTLRINGNPLLPTCEATAIAGAVQANGGAVSVSNNLEDECS